MKKQFFSTVLVFFLFVPLFAQIKESLPPSYRLDQTNKMDIYRAEAEKINSLIHTKLDLKFDYEKEEVNGEAWLTLKPHFYSTQTLVLDAKAMLIHEVALVQGKSKKKLKFTYDDWKITIDLDKIYTKNDEYSIYINYTARPNEVKQEGSAAISDAKGIYFINPKGEEPDKPTQIWTQGETVASSCWFPTIDEPNQKTSQEIYLTVPDKYVTLSNGKLEKQTKNSNGTRTDYWNFTQKHAPYLFFVGIGDFAIIKDKWKGKDVNYYVEHEYAPYAKDIFGNTPEMMQFFSDLLQYDYPWDNYEQIVGRDYVSGAMENTTATLHMENAQQKPGQLIDENSWESTIAHELFHHWFGDLVTMENFGNLSINESFANYSEYLWFEHKYGREKAEENRYSDLQIYKTDISHFPKDLVRLHYHSQEDLFDVVSYNKGGKGVLHMLRHYLGDEAFFSGLSKFLHDNEYGTAEIPQLRLALESVSGRDLNWFFNQWFYGNGHPQLNISYLYKPDTKKVQITVVQSQSNYFEFPFAFDVVVDGKINRHYVWISKKKTNTFDLEASKAPEVVIPNADQVILCEINDNKSIEEFAAQYYYGKNEFITRYLALEKASFAQTFNESSLSVLLTALNDSYEGIRISAINFLDASSPTVKTKASPILKKLATSDSKTLVRAAALDKLNEMGETDVSIFENGLNSLSFSVQAAAANGILRLNPERISELTHLPDEVIKSNPELVGALLDSWIATNDLSKLSIAAEAVAFYIFTQYENPVLGRKLEKGFNWVLGSDDMKSTKIVATQYKMVHKYYAKENPSLTMMLKNLLDQAIGLKVKTHQKSPSPGLEKQIEYLNDVKNSMN